ncbi:uncharacterized protein FIBRA_01979 [Fibroporia radiculosa]|uniref:Uncharacterized protein n=1 Tax=Fibroporia radiculosa TaxID=599839 RepID=J4H1K1_9APHY|nr:uncharacterized protein FIBRA_01979 [Fibroporia radiculosa]CCL99954.1 predicted protein [Fibroporia radiculosa]
MPVELGLYYIHVSPLTREVNRLQYMTVKPDLTLEGLTVAIEDLQRPQVDSLRIRIWKVNDPFSHEETLEDRLEKSDYMLEQVATRVRNPAQQIHSLLPSTALATRTLGKVKSLRKQPQLPPPECYFFYTIDHKKKVFQPPAVAAVQKCRSIRGTSTNNAHTRKVDEA